MKRLTSILLLFLFFLGTTGMPLNLHYCGDVLAGLSITQQRVDDTDCCGDNTNCCSDQEVKIDVDQDYLSVSIKQLKHNSAIALKANFNFLSVCATAFARQPLIVWDYSPPEQLRNASLQIYYCSFLI